jgi:hypothetical protein
MFNSPWLQCNATGTQNEMEWNGTMKIKILTILCAKLALPTKSLGY